MPVKIGPFGPLSKAEFPELRQQMARTRRPWQRLRLLAPRYTLTRP
jgi:hypothetical protein